MALAIMARRIVLVTVVMALAAPVWGQHHRQIRIVASGFSLNLNASTPPAVRGVNRFEGWSSLGPVSVDAVAGGSAPSPTIPAWCPEGTVRFLMPTGIPEVGIRFKASGDLLLVKGQVTLADGSVGPDPDGGLCVDPVAREFYGQVAGTVIGGTGRFEHATGTYQTTFRGRYFTPTFSDAVTMMEQRFEVRLDR